MKAFLALISAAWTYADGKRFWFCLYLTMSFAANIVLLIEPFAIGKLLNAVQATTVNGGQLGDMAVYFGVMILIPVGFWALDGPARVIENNLAFYARTRFMDRLFQIVTSLPIQWHRDHHSGQTINKMRKSTSALFEFMSNSYNFVEIIIKLFGSVVALYLLLPTASMIALAVSIVAILIVFAFDRVLVKSYEALNEKDHHVASALHDYITNVFTVITLRLEQLTQSELWKRMSHYAPKFRTNNVINEWKWFLTTIIISIMTVSVLAWYATSTLQSGNIILAGTFFMLYEYLQKVGGAFYTFAWKYSTTVQQFADLKASQTILSAEKAEYYRHPVLPKNWKSVSIQHLNFAYENTEHQTEHLSDISINLTRGTKIALVGSSGSGKSTLMSLIRGLHTTQDAHITCDGETMAEGLRCIAQHVTLIPQEPEIFSNTIEYNISVDTEQSAEEILEDVRIACFTPVLDRLPNGLKTDIAEKGVNLSGGEKQRLALARGIFAAKRSDIILLDEPTSSVDSPNELQIHKNIFETFADRCIVSSIHRLHLLPLFDYIYVMEKGRIIQEGKPKELMETDGALRTMLDRSTQSDVRD